MQHGILVLAEAVGGQDARSIKPGRTYDAGFRIDGNIRLNVWIYLRAKAKVTGAIAFVTQRPPQHRSMTLRLCHGRSDGNKTPCDIVVAMEASVLFDFEATGEMLRLDDLKMEKSINDQVVDLSCQPVPNKAQIMDHGMVGAAAVFEIKEVRSLTLSALPGSANSKLGLYVGPLGRRRIGEPLFDPRDLLVWFVRLYDHMRRSSFAIPSSKAAIPWQLRQVPASWLLQATIGPKFLPCP